MAEVLVVSDRLVKELITFQEAVEIVEDGFTQFHRKESTVYPAVREMVDEHDGIFGIKSSYLIKDKMIGLKAGGFWKNNVKKGKTNHQSTMLLFDPETGEPTCLMDANYITSIRTGAAGAIAAKHLARKDSKVAGIVGAGVQSRTQLEGLLMLFPIEKVYVYDMTRENAERFKNELSKPELDIVVADTAEQLANQADIIVTTTPSFTPIIKTSWVKQGTHINAIGSDTKGKRELEMDRKPDKLVCDLWEQGSIMGECQHGVKREELYAEIGEITSQEKKGRENDQEITVFDATGIAIQDLVVATYLYRKAKENNLGVKVEL